MKRLQHTVCPITGAMAIMVCGWPTFAFDAKVGPQVLFTYCTVTVNCVVCWTGPEVPVTVTV